MLPIAESYAHRAVESLEAESAAVSIDDVNTGSLRRMNILFEAWDTLGRVYFAEGKDALAEEYLRASWRNAAHAEVGLHMGEILEKKGVAPPNSDAEQALQSQRTFHVARPSGQKGSGMVAIQVSASKIETWQC